MPLRKLQNGTRLFEVKSSVASLDPTDSRELCCNRGTEPWSSVNKSFACPSPWRQHCYCSPHYSNANFWSRVPQSTTASAVDVGLRRTAGRLHPVIKRVYLFVFFFSVLQLTHTHTHGSHCTRRDCAPRQWIKRRATSVCMYMGVMRRSSSTRALGEEGLVGISTESAYYCPAE